MRLRYVKQGMKNVTITLLIVLMVLVIAAFGVLIYREQVDRTPEAILQPTKPPIFTTDSVMKEVVAYFDRYGGARPRNHGRSCAGPSQPRQNR